MLEAARLFVESGRRPRRSVMFIANTGEEKGLLGADYFAAHPTVPIGKIVSVVDLDMPLPLYDFTDVTAFGADHSTVAKTVADAGAAMGITVSPDPMPEELIFVRSDHYRFVLRGVPAILLMTGYANGGKAAVGPLSQYGLSFAARTTCRSRSTGSRRHAMASSIIASRARWPTSRGAPCGIAVTISATPMRRGSRAPSAELDFARAST